MTDRELPTTNELIDQLVLIDDDIDRLNAQKSRIYKLAAGLGIHHLTLRGAVKQRRAGRLRAANREPPRLVIRASAARISSLLKRASTNTTRAGARGGQIPIEDITRLRARAGIIS